MNTDGVMNWISVKDRLPERKDGETIVAIMNGRHEQHGDPIKDAEIVILRCSFDEWRSMDVCRRYYLPGEEYAEYWATIKYWTSWQDFGFPDEMVINRGNPDEVD